MNRNNSAYNDKKDIGKKMINTFDRFLDHRGCGVIYLDAELKIIKSNQIANEHLESKSCLVARDGKLITFDKEDNQKLIESLSASISTNQIGAVFLKREGSNKPCRLDFHPILDSVEIEGQQSILMLEIDRYGKSASVLSSAIKAYYGLTLAELSLVESIHQDVSLNNYAASKKIKISTVRWTLGNVFSKTGTCSQRELQSLVTIFSN